MYFNKGHPTNEFLFRLGTEDAATRMKPVPEPLTATQVTWNTNHVLEVTRRAKRCMCMVTFPLNTYTAKRKTPCSLS